MHPLMDSLIIPVLIQFQRYQYNDIMKIILMKEQEDVLV